MVENRVLVHEFLVGADVERQVVALAVREGVVIIIIIIIVVAEGVVRVLLDLLVAVHVIAVIEIIIIIINIVINIVEIVIVNIIIEIIIKIVERVVAINRIVVRGAAFEAHCDRILILILILILEAVVHYLVIIETMVKRGSDVVGVGGDVIENVEAYIIAVIIIIDVAFHPRVLHFRLQHRDRQFEKRSVIEKVIIRRKIALENVLLLLEQFLV